MYFILLSINIKAGDDYKLWLQYSPVTSQQMLGHYKKYIHEMVIGGDSETIKIAEKELSHALLKMLGVKVPVSDKATRENIVVAGTPETSEIIKNLNLKAKLENIGDEGYLITNTTYSGKNCLVIAAKKDIGVLYGVYHFLKLIQTNQEISNLNIESSPKIKLRLLNHWDNLDRTVERGYAGFSIWDWHRLPGYIDPRYTDYARANASVGINGTVVSNVNANALILTDYYLVKLKALAGVFRPYGIKVYLTARFSAPIEIGGLSTADPLNEDVKNWWKNKIKEIYSYIPDFGGFLVKANSEGQPGPQNYGRSHADGANMLAEALADYHGVVMWRAFVYDNNVPVDRTKQAYNEFKPLDGKLLDNVLVQVKNGPLDFQPREPFHPLFGAMPKTPLMMEFQITQEYLGFATHLVYLGPLYEECLQSDTYAKGQGSTVSKVIQGTPEDHHLSGIAGVANIGTDLNWCGHPFAQANWYVFGRMAWDPDITSETVADDWIRMTFSNDPSFIQPVKEMMLASREFTVNYMTPLGLHHIMDEGHHHGPGPWIDDAGRADWTSVYYHRADSIGIGFDRSPAGSNAVEQYFSPVKEIFGNPETCPDEYLLWFHRMKWNDITRSGRTLWDELCYRYHAGVDSVRQMKKVWNALETKIDTERFGKVKMLLAIQEEEAVMWRDACLLYFQTFSGLPIPAGLEQPKHPLGYYRNMKKYFVPGI
ncbi:MAG: alpha-glucuronidase [Bacteroidales bacterium]|nr:alpha-glucuronidase [Bacteroidales bacterium]